MPLISIGEKTPALSALFAALYVQELGKLSAGDPYGPLDLEVIAGAVGLDNENTAPVHRYLAVWRAIYGTFQAKSSVTQTLSAAEGVSSMNWGLLADLREMLDVVQDEPPPEE